MVESNISKALVDMEIRKWTSKDQGDVDADIASLRKVLRSKFQAMNSFERYMAELTTGTLKSGYATCGLSVREVFVRGVGVVAVCSSVVCGGDRHRRRRRFCCRSCHC